MENRRTKPSGRHPKASGSLWIAEAPARTYCIPWLPVGRARGYFGQPQYRCPGARDYGFAEARLCSRNLRRAVTRHDGGVRRRSK